MMKIKLTPSEFKNLKRIEYFKFEEDFMEENIRSIPTLPIEPLPDWGNLHQIPAILKEKMAEFQLIISINQWRKLTNIQRFALLKLCRPGHENKNFPKAITEFGLLNR